jgi:co-chaperonin GroES (HSP10)
MLTLPRTKIAVEILFEPDMIGSLYVPDQAKARANQGLVKYIGPAVNSVQIGDHILFGGYIGNTIHLEGEGSLIIVEEEFVQAIIIDEPTHVPGLFCKNKFGDFFPATLESALPLLRDTIRSSKVFQKQIKFYNERKEEDDNT